MSKDPLKWGELDLPLLGIGSDWSGKPLLPPLAFSLAADAENLWFVATRQAEACVHPDAFLGSFTPELWKYDTAELFIADDKTGRYLEFNLAPNGAWWAAEFSSPRVASVTQPDFKSNVTSHSGDESGQWLAALSIPLAFLRDTVDFGTGTKANATFILGSPEQTFHSAAKLPGAEPDFHQPSAFPILSTYPIP
ncbi:MAG: hypothetical protein NWS48_12995 [Akkermansiaceae bacterium]|nr:hypothetical protein [Akkermansiaceae bacterium]MDP4781545.1 hypothetical protein [Akkermansiaceae bacterium]MDP4995083.1 hypothetical protein [Akkermansiaceae bacterium]